MKIILAPSKTTKMQNSVYLSNKDLLFPKEHKKVLALLRKLSKTEVAKSLNIKGDILNNTYKNIKEYNKNHEYQAFPSFNGLVFKNLDIINYKEDEFKYITKNLRILDAFYGVLEPGTLIKPYRLDMKARIGSNLYKLWDISNHFKGEQIINLASDEFSKMIKNDMISIHFLQKKNDKYVNQATYSKMARGAFLDFMIKNRIEDVSQLNKFNQDNYSYNQEISDDFNLYFTR